MKTASLKDFMRALARELAPLIAAEMKKTSPNRGDWIRVDSLPGSKRSALVAARTGSLRAIKKGRTWLTTRADADAWLSSEKPAPAANDDDDDVRASLGLAPRRSA